MSFTSSWRELIGRELDRQCETFADVVACTISEEVLDERFNPDSHTIEGKPFTVWTRRRVYFPVEYDGNEWVCSVERNPSPISTVHVP